MKYRGIITFFLMLTLLDANAQKEFRNGYIITSKGDTLHGKIDFRGDMRMSNICRFISSDSTIKDYSPNDIKAYRFNDSKYFIAKEVNGSKVFLEFLIQGKVNMYYMRDMRGDHYFVDKEGMQMMELPYETGTKFVNDEPVYYESKKHIGILSYYMQDAPGLQQKINSMKEPRHNNLIKLAEDYHYAICNDKKCIVYEKKKFKPVVFVEVLGGISNYNTNQNLRMERKYGTDFLQDKTYFQAGALVHVNVAKHNNKLFLKTGLLYSNLKYNSIRYGETYNENVYKLLLHQEYIYPKGFFRPRASYGINIFFPGNNSTSLSAGANLQVAKSTFISITGDLEFYPIALIFPKYIYSYSVNIGLVMKL